jgi:striatin 1/3/4
MFGFEDEAKAQQELQEELAKYSRPGIISYLEHEWLNFQEEKEKWESERTQLVKHIDKLEKERKLFTNLKSDLLKRIRMLEYALLQER